MKAGQAEFDGPVISGERYVLADDFVGQGGTLANLRSHIIKDGGRVVRGRGKNYAKR
ncbi:hypothetical protein QUF72_02805 [Desulfobacterales bacterium HSG2]|nr:hypothetical protein [Desulfobacterales bacterium HSG2]